jgi:hypothetical protein
MQANARPEIGQPYNPVEWWGAGVTPLWLLKRKYPSKGAKLLFGLLTHFIGQEPPKVGELAEMLSVTERQLQLYLRELRTAGVLAEPGAGGRGNGTEYVFLWPHDAPETVKISSPISDVKGEASFTHSDANGEDDFTHSAETVKQSSPIQAPAEVQPLSPPAPPLSPREEFPNGNDPNATFAATASGFADTETPFGPVPAEKAKPVADVTAFKSQADTALFAYTGETGKGKWLEDTADALRRHFEGGVEFTLAMLNDAGRRARLGWEAECREKNIANRPRPTYLNLLLGALAEVAAESQRPQNNSDGLAPRKKLTVEEHHARQWALIERLREEEREKEAALAARRAARRAQEEGGLRPLPPLVLPPN